MSGDKYAAPKAHRPRRMSLVTETLARAAMTGTAFPPFAKCPDFPLVTFFALDRAPTDEDLTTTMRKIVSFDRLRSRVASFFGRKGQYMWAETPVDPDELMEHVSRREVGSEAEMRAAMDALIVDPLDVSRPLWDITVLTLSPGASWAPAPGWPPRPPLVCIRVSHAIGDGISLVSVLERICDDARVETLDFKRRPASAFTCGSVLADPTLIFSFLLWLFNCVYAVVAAVGTPFGPRDSKTAFYDASKKVQYSGKRTMVVGPSFALADLKRVKTKFGCTVNDVVCACLAGALHAYRVKRGDDVTGGAPRVRAAIAIPFLSGRPQTESSLCNRWTFVSLPLAMGDVTMVERLKTTKRRCDLMKSTPGAHAVSALNVVAANLLGPSFQSQTIYDFMSRHSMVFTNVPGPTKPVRIFGQEARAMTFGVGNIVNQVSVVSYAGKMSLSLVVDPDEVPEAHEIGTFFLEELRALDRQQEE
jgi:diacylglycerol O-acyltransferase